MNSGCVEQEVKVLLARPIPRSTEGLSSLLTDCAAFALQIRTAIAESQDDPAELQRLSKSSARLSALMGKIRQRLDRIASRP